MEVSTKGRTNYARLCRALFLSRDVLRSFLERDISPSLLPEKIKECLTLRLSQSHMVMVNDAPSKAYNDFDISLLYALLRNVCSSVQKPTKISWGERNLPKLHENSLGDDIERIRHVRNKVCAHISDSCITDSEFESQWNVLKSVMIRMDVRLETSGKYQEELDNIKTLSMDQDTENIYIIKQKELKELVNCEEAEIGPVTDVLYDRNGWNNLVVDGHPDSPQSSDIFHEPTSASSSYIQQSRELTSIYQRTPDGNPIFVTLSLKFICLICQTVLRDAVQSVCGHRFCLLCAESFFSNMRIKCPANEEDCTELSLQEIHRDTSARKEVRLLLVYCTFRNAGCTLEIAWKDLSNHEEICDYRLIDCKFRRLGCMEKVPFKYLDTHINNCKFFAIICKYCGEEMAKSLKKEHEQSTCKRYPIICQYGCTILKQPREEMERHMDECPIKPKTCAFSSIGCTFKGLDNDIEEHQQSAALKHVELTSRFAVKIKNEIHKTKNDMQIVCSERESYRQDLDRLKQSCLEIKMEEESLKDSVKGIKLKLVAQTERLIELERRFETCAQKSVVDYHSREIRSLKESVNRLKDRVETLERNGVFGSTSSQTSQTFARTQANILEQMKQHDRQIAIQDIQMAELDLRFQILETANYDGVLMWKIRDYKRRKQEAITQKTLSLYSQPFYTSRFGYKLCARVYLNGDGTGKGTHLSLYFVVMKGDYDALLQWPFRQQVTLSILDQDGRRCDVTESFLPDPTSQSYCQPRTEMNIATGCPQFISHRELETTTYCKDDTIFLKVVVKTDGISCP